MQRQQMKFEALSREYATLWDSMEIVRLEASIRKTAERIVAARDRYEAVQAITNVPWFVVGIIHAMETGLRFDRHLHNGDPLTKRTRLVPAGRPLGNGPFTFEQSCQDALCMKAYDKLPDWTIERICWALENYNGWGYRRYHKDTLSPYLWSGSNHYSRGKYVADGKWSKTAVSSQSGAMPLLKVISELCHDVPLVSMYGATPEPNELSPASNADANEGMSTATKGSIVGGGVIGAGTLATIDPVGLTSTLVAVKGNTGQLLTGIDLTTWAVPVVILAFAGAAIVYLRRSA